MRFDTVPRHGFRTRFDTVSRHSFRTRFDTVSRHGSRTRFDTVSGRSSRTRFDTVSYSRRLRPVWTRFGIFGHCQDTVPHGSDTVGTRFQGRCIPRAARLDTILLNTRYGSTRSDRVADTVRHDTCLSHFEHGLVRWGSLPSLTRFHTTRTQPFWKIQDTIQHAFKP